MKRNYSALVGKATLLVGAMALFFSCNETIEIPTNSSIVINTDSEQLSKRLSLNGSGVIGISAPSDPSGRMLSDDNAEKISLVLISQASSPTFEGNTLQATHVDIDGDFAYVGYNTAGATYLGAVEIFDISDIYKPKIVSQAIFKNADVSAIEYRNGLLFLAMAIDVDNSEVSDPANLGVVSVTNGQFTSEFKYISVPGFVATDVATTSEYIALVSGSNGLLAVFDRDLKKRGEVIVEDLRSVTFGENRLAILSGTKGASILNPTFLNEVASISLEEDVAQAKRTMAINNGYIYIAEGKNGAGVYGLTSGQNINRLFIPINPDNVESGDIVTNSVSVEDDLLFMANGAAGISIANVKDVEDFVEYGVLDLDGSSNFVRFENKFIFVATGAGGLQILKIVGNENQNGTNVVKCTGLKAYDGSSNLNVNSNETRAFSGSAQLKNVNVGGNLLFCGSLAIESSLNVNSNGVLEVNGSFAFGQYKKNTALNVNSNAVLRLSGSVVIYGDLRLNSGAKLEFVGQGTTVTIYGDVTINSGASITGNFTDTEGKLK